MLYLDVVSGCWFWMLVLDVVCISMVYDDVVVCRWMLYFDACCISMVYDDVVVCRWMLYMPVTPTGLHFLFQFTEVFIPPLGWFPLGSDTGVCVVLYGQTGTPSACVS